MGHPRRKHNPQLKARTTRSSRGRLLSLSDPAQTSQRLDDQLRALGLYAAPTIGDGNCLFRALSDQLYGTDSKHAPLRQHICDWIQHHKSRYEPFVEDERGIDTHLRCMRENATYGGHMELSAFAHMAQRNVKVVQPGLVYVIEWQAFVISSSPTTTPAPTLAFPDKEDLDADDDDLHSTIYVAYHDWEHFSSIRNLKGPHVGLPRVKERPVSPSDLLSPSPPVAADHYRPAKERKKAGKTRDRERKERKREIAREKAKSVHTGKGKHKVILTESEEEESEDADADEAYETEPEPGPEVSPEKLKIKLKLTLSNNNIPGHSPSSSLSNISEVDENNNNNIKPPQKTGLKLRLPPSRSLSVAPSNVSSPPTSQTSSTTTLPNNNNNTTTISAPYQHQHQHHTSSSSISDIYPSLADALPHANPPTHTSAPHLVSISRESSPGAVGGTGAGHRANRSPKRTFEESEIEDGRVGSARGVRSRLRGPEEDSMELEVVERLVGDVGDDDDNDDDDNEEVEEENGDGDGDESGDDITTVTTETRSTNTGTNTTTTSSSTLSSPEPSPPPLNDNEDQNQHSSLLSISSPHTPLPSSSSPQHMHVHEPSDDTIMTSPTTPTTASVVSHNDTPRPDVDVLPQEVTTRRTPRKQQLKSSPPPPSSSSSSPIPVPSPPTLRSSASVSPHMTRQQTKREALNNNNTNNNNTNNSRNRNKNKNDYHGGSTTVTTRMLTRRERKTLGLPKARRRMVGPYDRAGTGGGGAGGESGGKGTGKGGGGGGEGVEEEWRKNGTGRVDVRGFRELRI